VANFLLSDGEHEKSLTMSARDSELIRAALTARARGPLRLSLSLDVPVVAVGAPAKMYYPDIAARLNAACVVPEHGNVCNAIGAVVGGVVQRAEARITSPHRNTFRAHTADGIRDFDGLEEAVKFVSDELAVLARKRATESGGVDIEVSVAREDRAGHGPGGQEIFVETWLRATAAGRPRFGGGSASPK
jgi:N-methylhydantoinase A/oxoprolinase/acetone carboxylase beta subunit